MGADDPTASIRPYTPADRAGVTELWGEVFPTPAPRNAPGLVLDLKERMQPELFFVAEAEGRIVGTVMAGYDGHRGWIYTVAVAPGFRRRGIATRLMRDALKALRALGCVKVNLQILEENAAVAAFYETLGFRTEPRISMGLRFVEGD